jgi:hypothetical protein
MFHDESLKHMLIDHHQGRIIKISRFFIQERRRTYAQQKQIIVQNVKKLIEIRTTKPETG